MGRLRDGYNEYKLRQLKSREGGGSKEVGKTTPEVSTTK